MDLHIISKYLFFQSDTSTNINVRGKWVRMVWQIKLMF